MPTYDYKCSDGHVFEEFHSMNSEPVLVCPKCGKPAQRVIGSGSSLVFKGSGFYITDYKKPSAPSDNGKKDSGSKKD